MDGLPALPAAALVTGFRGRSLVWSVLLLVGLYVAAVDGRWLSVVHLLLRVA